MAISPVGYEAPRRFRGAAAHYLAGRPAYAGLLVRRVAPNGRLTEVIESSALVARRPGEDVAS